MEEFAEISNPVLIKTEDFKIEEKETESTKPENVICVQPSHSTSNEKPNRPGSSKSVASSDNSPQTCKERTSLIMTSGNIDISKSNVYIQNNASGVFMLL